MEKRAAWRFPYCKLWRNRLRRYAPTAKFLLELEIMSRRRKAPTGAVKQIPQCVQGKLRTRAYAHGYRRAAESDFVESWTRSSAAIERAEVGAPSALKIRARQPLVVGISGGKSAKGCQCVNVKRPGF